jgi:quercetin dioxygenase-like cupin family protein
MESFRERPAVFAIYFDAGARTRPHAHRSGQVHVTAGRRMIAGRSGRQVVLPGDVVTVAPDEWQWHCGDSPMTHLTVQVTEPGDIDGDVDEGDWAVDY